jgi:hypothetical protein
MKALLFATCLWLTTAHAAEYRTVTWFADHPTELAGVLRLCRDNAGQARHNPNCVNADEAQILVTERNLAQAMHPGDPTTPRYWQQRPAARAQQLWVCQTIQRQHARIDRTTAQVCRAAGATG